MEKVIIKVLNDLVKNKTIWITGGTSGIGLEMTRQLLEQGATVIVLARNEKKLLQLQDDATLKKGNLMTQMIEMSNEDSIKQAVKTLFNKGIIVDVLINNAGIGIFDHILDSKSEEIREMFDVNVLGSITLIKEILPHMLKNQRGQIIQIASQAGKLATPKSSVYGATKHAILGFSNALRLELADTPIQMTVVNPGPIRTPFFNVADKSGTYVTNMEKIMLKPEIVAQKIIKTIGSSKRELNLPWWMNFGAKIYHLMPGVIEKIASKQFNKK